MQNNDSSTQDERRKRFAVAVANCLDIWPEKTEAQLIEEMMRDGGWVKPDEQNGASANTRGQQLCAVNCSASPAVGVEWLALVHAVNACRYRGTDGREPMADRYYHGAWPFERIAEAALRLVVAAERQNDEALRRGEETP